VQPPQQQHHLPAQPPPPQQQNHYLLPQQQQQQQQRGRAHQGELSAPAQPELVKAFAEEYSRTAFGQGQAQQQQDKPHYTRHFLVATYPVSVDLVLS
jgi:hypothetical protein